jgi:hypothetical protein
MQEDKKQFYQYFGAKSIENIDCPHEKEVKHYWRSLCYENGLHNEKA